MRVLTQIALVAFGSALGGLARWGVHVAVARLVSTTFPLGTFLINVTGCFFLGWFITVLTTRIELPPTSWVTIEDLRLMIAVGFTGAYTTFSTYCFEADGMLREDETFLGLVYLVGSVVVGLLAVRLGMLVAR